VDKKPKRWDMNLHEAYLAKATELLAKAKVTRRDSDKANFERIAEIYFRLAAKAKQSVYPGNIIKHRRKYRSKKLAGNAAPLQSDCVIE
jgi:hypothetical protein